MPVLVREVLLEGGGQGGHGQGRKGIVRENVRGDALASVLVPEVLFRGNPGWSSSRENVWNNALMSRPGAASPVERSIACRSQITGGGVRWNANPSTGSSVGGETSGAEATKEGQCQCKCVNLLPCACTSTLLLAATVVFSAAIALKVACTLIHTCQTLHPHLNLQNPVPSTRTSILLLAAAVVFSAAMALNVACTLTPTCQTLHPHLHLNPIPAPRSCSWPQQWSSLQPWR